MNIHICGLYVKCLIFARLPRTWIWSTNINRNFKYKIS